MNVRSKAAELGRSLRLVWVGVVMALALGGCVAPGAGVGPGAAHGSAQNSESGTAARTNSSGDLITESDEPEATKRAKTRFQLASAYYGRGQLTVALDEVKLALAADPNLTEAHNLRGLIYAGLGDAKLAEESYRRALQISPRDADSMHNFGWFMCQQQRYPEANALFEQALQQPRYRSVTSTLLAQGVCQARDGALEQAARTLTKSYDLDPSNPATAVNLSEVLYRAGGYERARFYIQRVNSMPQVVNAQTLWLAVRIENKLGNKGGAGEIGFQLRNRYPESPEAKLFEQGQF